MHWVIHSPLIVQHVQLCHPTAIFPHHHRTVAINVKSISPVLCCLSWHFLYSSHPACLDLWHLTNIILLRKLSRWERKKDSETEIKGKRGSKQGRMQWRLKNEVRTEIWQRKQGNKAERKRRRRMKEEKNWQQRKQIADVVLTFPSLHLSTPGIIPRWLTLFSNAL